MAILRRLFMLLLLTGLAPAALAHLMPAGQGTVNLQGNSAFVVISIPVSALVQVDDSGDGRLSDSELERHCAAVESQVAWGVRLFSGASQGRLDFVQIGPDHAATGAASEAGAQQLVALLKIDFPAPPAQLGIIFNLFGARTAEQQVSIKALRAGQTDVVVLTPERRERTFFRPGGAVFLDYLDLGVEHVIGGADHLLFLMTVIVAGAGWRYWLSILTTFTLAHSMTLSLSLLGVWRVAPGPVETLIAASIVLMALLNLTPRNVAPPSRLALVFACGLLHGLGFGAAMAQRGLDGAHQITSLVGFNLGIELGQLLCLLAWLALAAAARALTRATRGAEPGGWTARAVQVMSADAMARTFSGVAILAGLVWMVQRLGPAA